MNINMDRLNESDVGCEREEFLTKDSTNVTIDKHDSSSGKDPKSNRCRQWIAVVLFLLAFAIIAVGVLAYLLANKKCDNDGKHNATVSTVDHYITSSKVEKQIQDEYLTNPNRLCSIKIPSNTTRLEGQSCFNQRQDCYPCNGTCLDANAMIEEINKHIKCNNSQTYIDCCIVLSVSGNGQCGDHGDLVCIKSTSTPVCQCHLGWIGQLCNETDTVKALCKCDMSNKTIADENTVPSCSSVGRPNDWNLCFHVPNNDTKCICANYKSDFFKDEKELADCLNDGSHEHYVHP